MSDPMALTDSHDTEQLAAWMARPDPFHGLEIPPNAKRVRMLGIYYLQTQPTGGGDLYVTRFGLPYLEHLQLSNWHEDAWFRTHREKLKGTSTVYKVPSKVVRGRSINLVVKWCRVGEEVPLDTMTFARFSDAEFNSPFEEFSLVIEMRESRHGPRILTHKPLAIYVPPEQIKLWQTGRSESRIARKKAKHRDVELDILRQYILIYEWVEGVSADEALDQVITDPRVRQPTLARLTEIAAHDMKQKGFYVVDHKPAHVILRVLPDHAILTRRNGDIPYALVDFELLMRTPEYEKTVERVRRTVYLMRQSRRFRHPEDSPLPYHLHPMRIFDVDYVWGYAESTHGMLWVVGRDPELFDFFLPERWRHTPRQHMSETAETYRTISKDHVKLVWKVSRVGETPEINPSTPRAEELFRRGYNSPFEEFALALELAREGIPTIYPRAIYRTGLESDRAGMYVTDLSRFLSHKSIRTPDDTPVLSREHNYITLWGFWQGRIDEVEEDRRSPCTGVDLVRAFRENLITEEEQRALVERTMDRLETAGFKAVPKSSHLLLSQESDGRLRREPDGTLTVTLCNFELIQRI